MNDTIITAAVHDVNELIKNNIINVNADAFIVPEEPVTLADLFNATEDYSLCEAIALNCEKQKVPITDRYRDRNVQFFRMEYVSGDYPSKAYTHYDRNMKWEASIYPHNVGPTISTPKGQIDLGWLYTQAVGEEHCIVRINTFNSADIYRLHFSFPGVNYTPLNILEGIEEKQLFTIPFVGILYKLEVLKYHDQYTYPGTDISSENWTAPFPDQDLVYSYDYPTYIDFQMHCKAAQLEYHYYERDFASVRDSLLSC